MHNNHTQIIVYRFPNRESRVICHYCGNVIFSKVQYQKRRFYLADVSKVPRLAVHLSYAPVYEKTGENVQSMMLTSAFRPTTSPIETRTLQPLRTTLARPLPNPSL